MIRTSSTPKLHLMFDGESRDVDLDALDVGDLSTDTEIRVAVSRHFDVPVSKMEAFTVDRNTETGDVTLRPQAVFGN